MPANTVSSQPESSSRRQARFPIFWWSAGLSALLAAAAYVYYGMFTGFSAWDDDGYVLIGIRSLLQGHRLYDDIYSQYGPFYYLVHWIVYSLLRYPVTHDTERFIGVVFWLVSAILWARVVYQLTRSRIWAGSAFFLAVKLLAFFPSSAGHPEEICMVLLSAVAVLACGLNSRRAGRSVAALACAVAALTLTKINIGLYLAIAIGLILLKASPPTRLQRSATFLLISAGLVLPVALMRPLLDFGWTRIYCFTATLAIASVTLIGDEVVITSFLTARAWLTAALSFLFVALAVILPFFYHGTSPSALLYMTVLQHAGFARNWYYAAPFGPTTLLANGVSLIVLVIVSIQRRIDKNKRPTRQTMDQSPRSALAGVNGFNWIGFIIPVVKATIGLAFLLAVVGLEPERVAILIFKDYVPFVWLLLIDPEDDTAMETRAGRFALCTIAVFAYLYAFPVAGDQAWFAALPVAMVGILLLRDSALTITRFFFTELPFRRVLRIVPAVVCLLILTILGSQLRRAYLSYENSVSLGMPGAERIRVTPKVAGLYRWMKFNLDSCPAIYSMPGLLSLYLWTDKESPTDLATGDVIGLLNDRQQRAVTRDLSRYQRMCIVYSPTLVEFWRRGQDLSRSPVLQYINAEFTATAEHDGYFIMKKK
jgi:hypothetical protein